MPKEEERERRGMPEEDRWREEEFRERNGVERINADGQGRERRRMREGENGGTGM